jgi:hypothetical protein
VTSNETRPLTAAGRPSRLREAVATFQRHGLDPERVGALALWAEQAHELTVTDDTVRRSGVLLSEDGLILARTATRGLSSRRVVTETEYDNDADLVGEPAGVALAELARRADLRVIHVTYHDV